MFESPSEMWGVMIGLYLFLGGLSGGAYVTGFAADYLRTRNDSTADAYGMTARWGMVVAFAAIGVGGLILLFHLGAPQNVIYLWLFTNTASWMAIGVWMIVLFVLLALIQALWLGFGRDGGFGIDAGPIDRIADATRPETKTRLAINGIGALVALTLIVYTAFLLSAVTPTVPLWHPILLPLLFLTSGLSMGICATVAVTALRKGVHGTGVHEFSLADDVVILGELGVLAALLWYLSGQTGAAADSYELLTQTFALEFWGIVVVLGLLVPLVISGALLVLERRDGVTIDGGTGTAVYTVKFGLVIIGGLFLRLSVLFASINVPLI